MVVDADKLETVGQEQFLRVVDAVNRRLTTDVIVGLNKAVTDGEDDGEVARAFLREEGLLEPLESDSR